jgi:hypothetical protein
VLQGNAKNDAVPHLSQHDQMAVVGEAARRGKLRGAEGEQRHLAGQLRADVKLRNSTALLAID